MLTIDGIGGYFPKEFIIEAIKTHMSQSKGKWISVEERLPDKQARFLIVDKDGQMNTALYTPQFGWFSGVRIKDITHWMPLPEPPKMKGGAE